MVDPDTSNTMADNQTIEHGQPVSALVTDPPAGG